jgi:hypothetical protein
MTYIMTHTVAVVTPLIRLREIHSLWAGGIQRAFSGAGNKPGDSSRNLNLPEEQTDKTYPA